MTKPQHILVIRFSAMGDVAMTVPVIQQVLQQHPQLQITMVSNAFLEPFFEGIERCHFYGAHLSSTHKGITGLYQLYRSLVERHRFDAVVDLHSVLRSLILRTFFKWKAIPIAVIDKGRAEKKALTTKKAKQLMPLTSTHERYAAVFHQAGFPVQLQLQQTVFAPRSLPGNFPLIDRAKPMIGVAPFAQHTEKMYPLDRMKMVVAQLAADGYPILLFGGKREAALLQSWAEEISGVYNMAGKYNLQEELAIISQLKVMVSMDSANMHLASLFAVPVVSVWGATHPFAGFNGWGQTAANQVQVDLYCRPCSIFGNHPCYRGDHACMNIAPLLVVEKVRALL